jgi:magnesium-transporting ATPase (P-type)
LALGGIGLLVGAASLGAYLFGHASGGDTTAQTMAFATLALSELALVFGIRSLRTAAWMLEPNRWLLASCAVSAAFVVALVYTPFTSGVFSTTPLTLAEAAVTGLLALLPIAGLETAKALARRFRAGELPSSASAAAAEDTRAGPVPRVTR